MQVRFKVKCLPHEPVRDSIVKRERRGGRAYRIDHGTSYWQAINPHSCVAQPSRRQESWWFKEALVSNRSPSLVQNRHGETGHINFGELPGVSTLD